MPRAIDYYSADMVRALPDDGNRYETVRGELLVSPAPRGRHQFVLGRLFLLLGNYLRDNGLEGLLWSPADISWGADTVVQPDLFVVDAAEARTGEWRAMQTLHLVIEALSPSSAQADRFTKRRLYQEQGIPMYWIVDIERNQIEAWTPDALFPVVERDRVIWRHPAAASDCIIEVQQLFE